MLDIAESHKSQWSKWVAVVAHCLHQLVFLPTHTHSGCPNFLQSHTYCKAICWPLKVGQIGIFATRKKELV